METKPGYKSSEFYLVLLWQLLSAFIASGVLLKTHWAVQAAAAIAGVLATLGYNKGRAMLKAETAKANPGIGTSPGATDPQ